MNKNTSLNKNLLWILAIILLCLAFSRNLLPFNKEILIGAGTSDAIDILSAHFFSTDCLKQHFLPHWNPYLFCGIPSLAEPQNAVFYPLNLIFLLLPLNIAFNYSVVLHLILAGIFMFYLARTLEIDGLSSFCTAIIFIFSSIFSLHLFAGHLTNIHTIIWLPLIFLLIEKYFKTRKIYYIVSAGISLSMQIFSGHLQYVTYTVLAIGSYLLFRFIIQPDDRLKIFKAGLYLITIGLLLSAIQLLPTAEYAIHSTRATKDYAFFSSLSFAPENLITIIIPDFFGNLMHGEFSYWGRWYFWEECVYMGILPLITAIIALRLCKKNKYVTFFGLLSLFSIIMALGYYIPLLKNIIMYIPILNMFRAQAKFIFLTAFSLSILSGFGINALFNNRESIKIEKKQIVYLYILIFLFAAIIFAIKARFDFWGEFWFKILAFLLSFQERYWIFDYRHPGFILTTFLVAYSGIRKFILFLTISLTLIIILKNKIIKSGIIKFLFIVFIVVDLWSFSVKYTKVLNLPEVLWSEEAVKVLKNDDTFYRIFNRDFVPNISVFYKLYTLNGSTALYLQDYSGFVASSQIFHSTENFVLYFTSSTKPLDLVGFKYLVTREYTINSKDFELVFSDNKIRFYKNLDTLPHAFMVFKAGIFDSKKDAMNEFNSKDFDPKEYVILETTDANKITVKPKDKTYNVQITKYFPNEVVVAVDTASDGYLFLSDAYYPSWKVSVDGKLDKIYKANIAFRAVYLKKGKHIVRFVYDSFSFKLGMVISLATLLFLIILISFLSIKSKTKIKR